MSRSGSTAVHRGCSSKPGFTTLANGAIFRSRLEGRDEVEPQAADERQPVVLHRGSRRKLEVSVVKRCNAGASHRLLHARRRSLRRKSTKPPPACQAPLTPQQGKATHPQVNKTASYVRGATDSAARNSSTHTSINDTEPATPSAEKGEVARGAGEERAQARARARVEGRRRTKGAGEERAQARARARAKAPHERGRRGACPGKSDSGGTAPHDATNNTTTQRSTTEARRAPHDKTETRSTTGTHQDAAVGACGE